MGIFNWREQSPFESLAAHMKHVRSCVDLVLPMFECVRAREYERLKQIADACRMPLELKGRGLMIGLACADGASAAAVCRAALKRGLIVETSGSHDEVVKCLPALTIEDEDLERGLAILAESFKEVDAR